ncbi:MAG: hypothetical protein LBQ91_06265 [Oscillospiraceae bacterium]|jgi:hypothetical protein|nr:hypothetical protein [Oscillospiraceae bacterium]
MLEVCRIFNMRISEYRALPNGERLLYDKYAVFAHEESIKRSSLSPGI